ncbi:hypothetical protein ACOSQ3_030833 [Xanthoceras sorbifolium]
MASIEISQVNASTGSGNNESRDIEPSSVSRSSKRKREKSFIWNYMTKVDVDGVSKAKYTFCGKLLLCSHERGTSTLRRHVERCLSKYQVTTNETDILFDQNVGRAKIARMIIVHELPLRFVEYMGFREMMEYCQPRYEVLSRNTLKSEIFK